MNIILISECRKKAAITSRRILSKYARHIARRTWIASITQQGLEHLQQELLNVATKNSAIACHKVLRRDEIVLAWIIGSRKQFDDAGNFAFRYTENLSEYYQINLSDSARQVIKLFSYLNKLAGLFHDVGKNFYYFQDKLIQGKTGKAAGDPIRHEYLSFLCFINLWDFSQTSYPLQLNGFQKNITQLSQGEFLNKVLSCFDEELFRKIFLEENPQLKLVKLLSHLILSHHRLISSSNDATKIVYDEKESYFNKVYNDLNKQEKQKIVSLYQSQALVLFDENWKKQIFHVLDSLTYLLNTQSDAVKEILNDNNTLMSVTHYILRPALIMADQKVSARSSKIKESDRLKADYSDKTPIANKHAGKFNQHLQEHLAWVGQSSFKNNKVLFQSILSNKRLYKVPTPKRLLTATPASLPQFQWQDAAVNATQVIDKNKRFGFFGVVMAETGAGKTRANAKIMAALSDPKEGALRFSTLLGLRTLTLQTLDEYRDNLALTNHAVIGIIGDQNSQNLHEFNQNQSKEKIQESQECSSLSELFKQEAAINIIGKDFKDVDTPFPDIFDFPNQRDSKLDRIIKTPVLVATIDYMIRGIDADRSSKSRFLNRLMTSDVIIDEIDSYNKNDLMAIHKLVYLVGFYGKKLIISSATLPELLIESFYSSYFTGYQRFQVYTDTQNIPLYIGLFTHHQHLNQVNKIDLDNKDIAKKVLHPFIEKFYQAIKKEPIKRRASVLDISPYLHQNLKSQDNQAETLAPLYQQIFTQAEQLHSKNHTKIGDITVSTGLIKFNNTVDAFNFSRYLFDQTNLEDHAIVRIECYHARHFPIRRNYTEVCLKSLLNRNKKTAKQTRFKDVDLVQSALYAAKKQHKKQVLLLVVSTTIIEIGRDFDFDWGIIEPASHGSIIQTAGRVMRHRQKDYYDNIVLLSHSMKAIRYPKNSQRIYSLPGPESDADHCLSEADKYQPLEMLFEYQQLSIKIDASITLKNQIGQPIKMLENKQIQSFKASRALGSLHSYLNNPQEYLSTFNSDQNPFRGKYQQQTIYRLSEYNKWEVIDKRKNIALAANDQFEFIQLRYPERALLNQTLEAIEAEYALKNIQLPREIHSLSDIDQIKKYNVFLGVL